MEGDEGPEEEMVMGDVGAEGRRGGEVVEEKTLEVRFGKKN